MTQPTDAGEALRLSQERYALATRAGRVAVWDYDVARDAFFADPLLTEMWGGFAGEVTDLQTWGRRIHPDDLPVVTRAFEDHLAGRVGEFRAEYRFTPPGGPEHWALTRGTAVRDAAGRPVRVVGTTTDITDRKRAELALADSEQRLRLALDAARLGTWAWDVRAGTIRWDAYHHELFGLPPGAFPGTYAAFLDLVHPDDRPPVQAAAVLATASRGQFHAEFRVRRPDGQVRWMEATGRAVPGPDAAPARVLGVVHDVTDRKAAEEDQRAATERLHALSRRLLEVQEQERRHLARELHDEVGQLLTALSYQVELAARAPAAEAPARLAEARALVRDLTAHVRDLSLRLRPTMLDDLGLVPALVWLADRVSAQTGVRVAVEHRGADGPVPPAVATAAYRIVQEALTNVARHAGVRRAAVRLARVGGALTVTVGDAGTGFDPAAAADGRTGGLSGMRERAELLGGTFEVESAPGRGTRVTARLPIDEGTV
jgi:PAS domain S-box-containing protein